MDEWDNLLQNCPQTLPLPVYFVSDLIKQKSLQYCCDHKKLLVFVLTLTAQNKLAAEDTLFLFIFNFQRK